MNKTFRVLACFAMFVLLMGASVLWLGRSRAGFSLAKYKAELRAGGEKLSWAEMGYPRLPLTNDSLPQLLAAADRLGKLTFKPGQIGNMNFVRPGQVRPQWSSVNPQFLSDASSKAESMSWVKFDEVFGQAEADLQAIRAGLENPPRYFNVAPSNVFNLPRNPFVEKRVIAQWLSGDTIAALHAGQLARAQADLHALVQLVQLHRDEPTLVNQMIRVAITGLALADTWEALFAPGWTEESLAALQEDWENVDVIGTFEIGIESDRVFGAEAIRLLRALSARERWKLVRSTTSTAAKPQDYFERWVAFPLWGLNADSDELLYLQHHQQCLESFRKLRSGTAWPVVHGELTNQFANLNAVFTNKMASIRYWFSAMGIPSIGRAGQTAVRHETQRCLTITAIALQRYRLRHGQYPMDLSALAPTCLKSIPIDLMSARPLCYRLNADGRFTLYSVGEDGVDDGGDPTSCTATNKFDLWTGRDAVWPVSNGGSPEL